MEQSDIGTSDGLCDATVLDWQKHNLQYAGDDNQYIRDGLKYMTCGCTRCSFIIYAANITVPVT